jgi:hypothetical protein
MAGFLERALKDIHADYARVATLLEAGKLEEGREAARALQGSSDPYLAAHACLALVEAEFRALAEKSGAAESPSSPGKATIEDWERIIRSCERIVEKDRLYLARDHRACELIALAFERLGKPLLELVQYAILLTDYNDLPGDVVERVKARIAKLSEETGQPLTTVADWMNEVEKLLGKEITTKDPTQRKETEIVYALDKLIELQDARERKT